MLSIRPTAIVLALSLSAAAPAQAAMSFCSTDPMVYTMINASLALSQDIGTMADRILATEDKIGDMADRIGVMADRIVATETLMADTLLQLSQASQSGLGGQGVLLLSPATGDAASRSVPPLLQLSNGAASYVLYVSPTGAFEDGKVLPLLVTSEAMLSQVWSRAMQMLSGDVVYLAVRSVDGNSQLSQFSNAVRLTLY
jgi:hypothetical protein